MAVAQEQQPLHPGQGARTDLKPRYPDNEVSGSTPRGTNTDYLMARLLCLDPEVADKIGFSVLRNVTATTHCQQ